MSLWRALLRFFRGDGMVFSGYLAFLSLLALLPVLGVLFWFSQQSTIIRTADAAFRDFLFTNLIPDAAKQVVGIVDKLRSNARGLGILGVAIIAIDLVLKALALTAAVDRLWTGGRRRWWGFFNGAFVLLVIVPPVVGMLYWLIRFVEKFMMNLFPVARGFFDSAFDPFAIAIPLIAALTLLYRWIPPNVKSWRSPFAAALAVALLIELARYVITHHFATLTQLKSLYGAFVAIPVLMVSAFVLWALVLYGAALVAEGFGKNLRLPSMTSSNRGKSQSAATTKSATVAPNSKTK
ncbi:MAG: YhjD/YihY/BrkB family envelope integrity protein [Casimicrobium sp.]